MTCASVTPSAPQRPAPPLVPISFEEFLAWADEDTRAEWVAGEVVLMSPRSAEHQHLLGFLDTLISGFVLARQLATVLFAPFLMRLPTGFQLRVAWLWRRPLPTPGEVGREIGV